jgi:glucose/arabinose dehydrogenase
MLVLALLMGCQGQLQPRTGSHAPTPPATVGPTATVPAPTELWSIPAGFELERVVEGLYLPVNLAFVPDPGPDPEDPKFYVLELYGTVKVVLNSGAVRTYADGLLNFDPTARFPGSGEAGSIGIAVHPATGDLFVSLAYKDPNITFGDGKLAFANKVVRLSSSDGGLTADEQTTLIEGIGPSGTAHQVQKVTVGPDGMVYVNVGDGGRSDANYNPAQDPTDLRGKVLRMTPDGAIPADNPDPNSYVYAQGFRNPFGAAWRGADDHLYISDNGPAENDRLVKVRPGSNYGWCCDMTVGAIYLWREIVAPTAIGFMEDGQFPRDYAGHLFVGSVGFTYGIMPWDNGKRIFDVALDAVGNVEEVTDFVVYEGEGYSTVVGLAFGPDGLYFTDMYGEAGFDDQGNLNAGVYRVRWTGAVDGSPR